mgnify:CR=1 FL=1
MKGNAKQYNVGHRKNEFPMASAGLKGKGSPAKKLHPISKRSRPVKPAQDILENAGQGILSDPEKSQ